MFRKNKTQQTTLTLRLIVGLALIASLFLGAAYPVFASGPVPDEATAEFERDFLKTMIDHHAMAVMEAEVCLAKAAREELRQLCANIITAQSQEIAMMQSWLQAWYGISYNPQMSSGEMQKVEKLAGLDGTKFEIKFMITMIKHHGMAIMEAERCLKHGEHAELVSLCQNIIATQRIEIRQMKTWLCDWDGLCQDF
ncbi:MAG: hypothetical protein Fur0022_01040 [Anaerolineales bacterium]